MATEQEAPQHGAIRSFARRRLSFPRRERLRRRAGVWGGGFRRGRLGSAALHPDAVRQILRKRAAAAGLTVASVERLSPHGLRAGFVTEAYAAGARDEQIMAHTRHRDLKTMRGYVRHAKLGTESPAKLLGL